MYKYRHSGECPCKGCSDRVSGPGGNCHSFCSKYKDWKAVIDEESRVIREAKSKEYAIPFHKAGIVGYKNKVTGGLGL